MAEENPQPTSDINVTATDATTIYEGGRLVQIKVGDLLNNEVALRQFVNNYNLANKDLSQAQAEITSLKEEVSVYLLYPVVTILIAAFNIPGVVLIGISTSMIAGDKNTGLAYCLLILGGLITLASTVGSAISQFLPKWLRKGSSHAS